MNKKMQKVVLISCSKSKHGYPCKARELYDPSPLFRKSLAYAETISDDIYVLSAKYRLLNLDQVVESYDLSLYDMTTHELKSWGEEVAKMIRSQYDVNNTEFIVLAGKTYCSPLQEHLPKEKVITPLAGMRMGERLAELDRLIATSDQGQTLCYRLHKLFNEMPRFYWDSIDDVPFNNGIYIIFQANEKYHNFDRVVRVGTHRSDGRLKGRLKDHFLRENKDGSIFRKNIGRALLNLNNHNYLYIWNRNTSKPYVLEELGSNYNPRFQAIIEGKISKFLRECFSFVCFPVNSVNDRHRLEEGIIATLNLTSDFGPSSKWSGKHSPEREIKQSGMWQKQGLDGNPLSESEFLKIEKYCTSLNPDLKKSSQHKSHHSKSGASLNKTIESENSTRA